MFGPNMHEGLRNIARRSATFAAVLAGIVTTASSARSTGPGFGPIPRPKPGPIWAWGHNLFGQLGNGTTVSPTTPVEMRGPGGRGHLVSSALETGCCGGPALAIGTPTTTEGKK